MGGGLPGHAGGRVLPRRVVPQPFGNAVVVGEERRCLGARGFEGGEQGLSLGKRSIRRELDGPRRRLPRLVSLGKRSIRRELDGPRQRLPRLVEPRCRRGEPRLGVGGLALEALSLGSERGDRVDRIPGGVARGPGDLLGAGESGPVACVPIGGQAAAADRTGVAGVEAVGGGGGRFGSPRGLQVVVGGVGLVRRAVVGLVRRFQVPRARRVLCPERVESLAALGELGRPFRTPGVLLPGGVPALPSRAGGLVERGAPRGLRGGLLPGRGGALGPALRFRVLPGRVLDAGAERGRRFRAEGREGAQAPERRQGRRDLPARGAVVGGDARELLLQVRQALLQGGVLFAKLPVEGGERR